MLKDGFEYNFSYDDAIILLTKTAKTYILSKYPIRDFILDETSRGSHIQQCQIKKLHASPEDLRYDCIIGIEKLEKHKATFDDGITYVRDIDLIGNIKNIFHESEHLNQHLNICQNSLSGENLDMAKMLMLNDLLDGYKKNTYQYNISEINAEIKACEKTIALVNQLVDEKNQPVLNAKECLYGHYRELEYNRIWYSNVDVHDYDSMIESLYDLKTVYLTANRGITFTNNSVDQSILNDIKKSKNWKELFMGDRVGKQYDDKLFAIVDACAPQWSQTHTGIQDEAKRLRKEYPKNFPPLEQALDFINKLKNKEL